ncbi:RICIN domain-containing protein [Nocardioides caeni]|uniref:Ricin B lectin domain-containing protein n=1 Tax=Nocardioides caeni TaxID=574700 RepID=A0A4V4HK30_9ACTN|nr:RICIN domain-containing protein [Nocardioides caeni]THV12886.1 hypothetical protein E9934_10860 [Nocardioides caeni]
MVSWLRGVLVVVLGTVLAAGSLLATEGGHASAARTGGPVAETAGVKAVAPATLVHVVRHEGQVLRLRLQLVRTRTPGFRVLVQGDSGSFATAAAPAQRSYLGTVDGRSGLVAGGILRSDGKFEGLVVFDRGGTWHVVDGAVVGTRGMTQPTTFRWPDAADASRNVTLLPGRITPVTRRWDIGYDLAHRWFTGPTIGGSVDRALDAVEFSTIALRLVYETNARLRPATGRVVIRSSATAEPYGAYDDVLADARDDWAAAQADAGVDAIVVWQGSPGGGGVAWVGTITGPSAISSNGGTGTPWVVTRHELGHNWGARDNHTNGPEGATIESGNQFHRFDGTELRAILDQRDRVRGQLPWVRESLVPLPPYAALDLVRHQTSGTPFSFRPTRNDHDANTDAVRLRRVDARSHLGGRVSQAGSVVTYTPPAVASPTTDFVRYVAVDETGRTATGVALFQVAPAPTPGPVGSWPVEAPLPGRDYAVRNTQSGLWAGVGDGSAPVQRTRSGQLAALALRRAGGAYTVRQAGAGCLTAVTRGRTEFRRCGTGLAQRFRVVEHPVVGSAVVNMARGTCLMPAGASMAAGARLVHVPCRLLLAQSWDVTPPPAVAWPYVVPPTGQVALRQVTSGLLAGVPDGATGSTGLSTRAEGGTATQVTFVKRAVLAHQVVSALTGRCFDAYDATAGGEVGTWGCGTQDNQRWQVRANPAGGFSFRLDRGGLCLGVADVAAGTGLTMQPCTLDASVRWRIER